jgi:hypothetical protein
MKVWHAMKLFVEVGVIDIGKSRYFRRPSLSFRIRFIGCTCWAFRRLFCILLFFDLLRAAKRSSRLFIDVVMATFDVQIFAASTTFTRFGRHVWLYGRGDAFDLLQYNHTLSHALPTAMSQMVDHKQIVYLLFFSDRHHKDVLMKSLLVVALQNPLPTSSTLDFRAWNLPRPSFDLSTGP